MSTQHPFDHDSLQEQIRKLPDLPVEAVRVGGVVQNGEAGVEVSVNKDLGKGFFTQEEGSWFTRSGYRVAAMFGWSGKKP